MTGRRPRRRPEPVAVTWLPVVRCLICGQTMAHQRGEAGAVLTRHYGDKHPELIRAPRHVSRNDRY